MAIEASRYVVGGDLGGTRFRAILADHRGAIVQRVSTLTRANEGRDAVIERILDNLKAVIAPVGVHCVVGVGISAPGPLNPWTGVVYSPPNLPGWSAEPLKDIVEQALGVPCLIGNDANL